MKKEEEIEIAALKKELDASGEENMSKGRRNRYIFLRRQQKSERRQAHEINSQRTSKSAVGMHGILLGLIPLLSLLYLFGVSSAGSSAKPAAIVLLA